MWAALKADVKVIFAVNPNNKLKAFPLELLHNYHVCVLDHFCRVTKADFDHLAPPMPTTEFRDQLPEIFKNLGSSMVVVVPRDTAGSAEVFYWNTGGPASSAASAAGAAAPKPKRATKPDSGAAAHVSKTKHARPEERKASAPSKGSAAAAVSVPAAAAADRGLSTPCVVEAELGFSQDDARSRVRAEGHPRPPAASAAVSTTTAAATPAQTSAVPTAAASAASAASVASASTSAALAGAKRTATHALGEDCPRLLYRACASAVFRYCLLVHGAQTRMTTASSTSSRFARQPLPTRTRLLARRTADRTRRRYPGGPTLSTRHPKATRPRVRRPSRRAAARTLMRGLIRAPIRARARVLKSNNATVSASLPHVACDCM